MSQFVINGGRRVSGVHTVPGNKNAALPMLAACLLTDEPVELSNLPLIEDVRVMLSLLGELGVAVSLDEPARRATLCAASLRPRRLSRELCSRVRTSILFAGPLLARHGAASIFPPGGDAIGRRRIDTHVDGLRALGASVRAGASFSFRSKRLHGAPILLDEASVTGTENLVMAATLAEGRTTIYNAACEPHVQDLCRMLNAMGARISGIGTNLLSIEGVEALHGVSHRVGPDLVDAGSFMAAALATGGELKLVDAGSADDWAIVGRPFRRIGARWTLSADGTLHLPAGQRLKAANDFGDAIPKFEDGPWPAFPSDLLSALIVLATQTRGTMLFFEKMFESRLYFVDRLIGMGAHIVQCDPHRVVVSGPCALHATTVASPDIRAGMALLVAALCAKGTSVIRNAEVVDRGHARVEDEFRALGADIRRE